MSEAPSVKSYRKVLDQLGSGDAVHPVEEMRDQAMTLIDKLLSLEAEAVAEDGKAALKPPLETFLALALPLIVHGGEPGKRTVVGALQALASETASSEGQKNTAVLTAGLHHLTLWTLAYALAHDRTDLVPALTSIVIPNRYEAGQTPIFEWGDVRHAAVFAGNASDTFKSARELFLATDLRFEIPYLRRDDDCDAALAEAELISAMCLADPNNQGRTTYCNVIGGGGAAERRLRARVAGEGAADLAHVYGVALDELTEELNRLYATLGGEGMFASPTGPLIYVKE